MIINEQNEQLELYLHFKNSLKKYLSTDKNKISKI